MSQVLPDNYLLGFVAAAIAGGANFIEITDTPNATSLYFDGKNLNADQLRELLDPELGGRLKTLGRAVRTVVEAAPPRFTLDCWDGSSGARLRVADGSATVETLSKTPWKGGEAANQARIEFKTGLRKNIMLSGSSELSAAGKLVKERCRDAAVRLEINGTNVTEAVDLGECLLWLFLTPETDSRTTRLNPRTPKALLEHRSQTEGNYSAVLGMDCELEGVRVVVHGVTFEVEVPVLEELGIGGVVAYPELTVAEDGDSIIEDDLFESFLTGLEEDALDCTDLLLDNLDKMDEEQVEKVLEAVTYLVELSRNSEDFEESVRLLKKLLTAQVEAFGEDCAEVAETITYIAQAEESLSEWEECYQHYRDAITLWDRVDEPDQALLAVCLNGLAQIDFSVDQLDQAERLAERALEIRREICEPNELDLGVSAELLARVYSSIYAYPNRKYLAVEKLYKEALGAFEASYGSHHSEVASLLNDFGEYYRMQRRYTEAEPCYLRALATREKLLGGSDPAVGETLDALGSLYEDQGQSTKAGRYYNKALELWTRARGPEDPEVAQRLNNLVVLYRVYGKYAEAEPLYQRILEIREQQVGKDSVELVPDMVSLALLYQLQSKYAQAEPVMLKACQILEEQLGEKEASPELAWVLNLMGGLFDERYQFKKAEEHLDRALKCWEQILGTKHPDVAVSVDFLVRHYRIQQRYEEAAPFARRSLSIVEQFYGTRHPATATALSTLAELLRLGGKAKEARPLYQAAREIREEVEKRGYARPEHELENLELCRYTRARQTAQELHDQAVAPAREYSRYMEAEHLYLRALFAREQVLGPGHHDNAYTLDALADLYRTHHKFEGAVSLHERALELRRKSLGRDHPDTCISLKHLVLTYLMMEEFDKAEPHLQKWGELATLQLGEDHVEVADVLYHRARVAESRKDLETTEASLKEAMELRHKALGTEHPLFATALAELLRVRGSFEQAAKLYGFVVSSLEESVGPESVELIPVMENYALVLNGLEREDEAASMETRAMVLRVGHGLDFG